MLRDDYEMQYETTVRASDPTLLRRNDVHRDQGWSWVVLLAAFLTLFVTNGVHTSFGILYAALISHFQSGREETAWIGSISLGLLCFFSPIASLLIENIGCRATSAIGGFLCSLGFLLSSFATGIALLYFTHGVLFGLGTSLTYTAAMTVVTRSFDRKRNIATGLCTSGSQFGGISLAPLSQVLFDRLGYANTFRTFSGLLLIVAISSLAYRPVLVENKTSDSTKKSPKEMLHVWKNKAYVVWALSSTMVTLGYNIPRYTLVKYAIDLDISKDASAWLLSYLCVTSAIGRIVFGRLCESIPKLYLCQICVVCCAISAILFPFLKTYLGLVISCFIFGLPDGGFVASLPMVTTEIVGQERMSEGFGFMLFCQSYSNVIGPPLSGMLFDTYHSYKAAFCFAAVPEIIGALAMFLIPYYTRNQVSYRREIGLNSQSGILVEDGINTSVSPGPKSAQPVTLTQPQEQIGSYNVIINLPVPLSSSDIKQVNVIIRNTSKDKNAIEAEVLEAELSSNYEKGVVGVTNGIAEKNPNIECESISYEKNTASNSTIVASECFSATNDNMEYPQPQMKVGQELVAVESGNLQTVSTVGEIVEETNENISSAQKILADTYLPSNGEFNNAAPTSDLNCKIAEALGQNEILSTVPSHQLLTETIVDVESPSCSEPTKRPDVCVNNEIIDLIPEIKTSHNSILSVSSSAKVLTTSNVAFAPDENEEQESIIKLNQETCPPRLTPPPNQKSHSMRIVGEVINSIDLTEQVHEPYIDIPISPMVSSHTTPVFPPSLEVFAQDNHSCSHDLAFPNEIADPGKSLGFKPNVIVNPNESSFMSSVGISDTFPLVQDSLPEPLKPTSVCSVSGNTQATSQSTETHQNSNLEKMSASSPLSCELSTVIADVIQSLTSQNTAMHKSNKEATVPSNGTSTAKSPSREHVNEPKCFQLDTNDGNMENSNSRGRKDSFPSAKSPFGQVSPRSKIQTSVLDTMQSIVAEGCPEDSALLEDISIDLSLDKDPSVASIVLIEENDIGMRHERSSSCVKISGNSCCGQINSLISVQDHLQRVESTTVVACTGASAISNREQSMLDPFLEPLAAKTMVEMQTIANTVHSTEGNPFYNNKNDNHQNTSGNNNNNDSDNNFNPPMLSDDAHEVNSVDSTNPFFNNDDNNNNNDDDNDNIVNLMTSTDDSDKVNPMDSNNPFYSNNVCPTTSADTSDALLNPIDSTNPFYNNREKH